MHMVPPVKAELLAPAGSLETFFAALEKGADAVYAGLKDFSARAKAKNFTLAELERMLAYAHGQGRRIYVTVNTLVKETELPLLVETLAALEEMGADGVIVQDLGVARLVRRHFPGLELHASTQLTIHNTLGVRQLAELGFQRVVLARELHLDEIREIVRQSPIGIECFIHGALCFSFSGQCFFSSWLGGHSGNRGRCAQPCRRLYRYRGKEGYWFSPNDFSSIDLLPQLVAAGIISLKIEGRMKSAEYVANVVEAYRMVLDATPVTLPNVTVAAKELLRRSFGRVPTRGFLASHTPTDIATPSLKGATGRFLGEIKGVRDGLISFESRDRLHVGDRLRVQPKSDEAGRGFTVREIRLGKRQVQNAPERSMVAVPVPFACRPGDAVFKVSSETAFTLSENACRRRLAGAGRLRLPLDLTVALTDGTLRVIARAGGGSFSWEQRLGELESARTVDMTEVLRHHFAKSGDFPFVLRSLTAPDFPAKLIPAALFRQVRQAFYGWLAEELAGTVGERRRQAIQAALAEIVPRHATTAGGREELLVRVESSRELTLLHQEGVSGLVLPISRANLRDLPAALRKARGREGRVVWSLPFIIFDREEVWYREALQVLREAGFHRFEATNMGHFPLLAGAEVELATGYRLYSLNSLALQEWAELGADSAILSIEDDRENVAMLLAADLPIRRRVLLHGPVPVIVSKIALRGVKADAPMVSDRGDQYLVSERGGLSYIMARRPFSITGHMAWLRERGCSAFEVDLTGEPREGWRTVLDAVRRGAPEPETSEFNFAIGLL